MVQIDAKKVGLTQEMGKVYHQPVQTGEIIFKDFNGYWKADDI